MTAPNGGEAIAGLLTQRNVEEAAHAAGIGTRTPSPPESLAAYREARRAAFGQCIARLQQGVASVSPVRRSDWKTSKHAWRRWNVPPRRPSKRGEIEPGDTRMITRNLSRRLERLETSLMPASDQVPARDKGTGAGLTVAEILHRWTRTVVSESHRAITGGQQILRLRPLDQVTRQVASILSPA
jgi:hypothetical protein